MISFSGVWVKFADVAPSVSAFYRVFIASILLLFAALYKRELTFRSAKLLPIASLCGFVYALDLFFYHYSIESIGPGLATILPNFQVFILSGIGLLFLKEKVRLIFLISIPLAFFGLMLIVGFDWTEFDQTYKTGIYYGFFAAACYAGFILLLKKLQSDEAGLSVFSVLMIVCFTTSVFLGAEIYIDGASFAIPDLQSFFSLFALSLFSQFSGWILITNALPEIRASLSGFILLLQPALAFVWDVLLFQRPTNTMNWVGVLITLFAIYIGTAKTANSGKG